MVRFRLSRIIEDLYSMLSKSRLDNLLLKEVEHNLEGLVVKSFFLQLCTPTFPSKNTPFLIHLHV
jgi:hypothetical protein